MSDAQTAADSGPYTVESAANALMGFVKDDMPKQERAQDDEQSEAGQPAEQEPQQNAHVEGEEEPAEQAAEGEAEQEAPKADAPAKYKVEVDGEEREYTADELVQEFARKPQKVQQREQALEQQAQYLKIQLEQIIPALQQAAQGKYAGVDWVKLSKEDPAAYIALQAEYQADTGRIQIAQAERQRLQQHDEAKKHTERKQWLASQEKELVKAIPEWSKDPEKAKTELKEIRSFVRSCGVAEGVANQLADARMVLIARDAMRYRQAQKAKAEAAKNPKDVPPVQKPGASNMGPRGAKAQQFTESMGRLRKHGGRIDDGAAAIRALGIV